MKARLLGSQPPIMVGVVALAYIAAAELGFSLAFATKQVTAVWPPTGIAVAALLRFGARVWLGIFLGAFAANALSEEPLLTAAMIAVGNTLGPLLGSLLLRGTGFQSGFQRPADIARLVVFGAALPMCVTATNGVLALVAAGIVPRAAASSVWWVWWAGDTLGVLLFTPLVLAWAEDRRLRWSGAKALELVFATVTVLAATIATFRFDLLMIYAVFPPLAWIVLRFGPRESATAAVLISVISIWNTAHDYGPFKTGSLDHRLIMLMTLMVVLATTTLLLRAVRARAIVS